jgi:PAS domain S-box-containing protein
MARERSTRLDRFPALIVLAGAFAAGIFIVDMIAPPEVDLAVLYIAVVLIAARCLQRRGLLLTAIGCSGLAVLNHILSQTPSSTVAEVNLILGLVAIAASTYLALLNKSSVLASRERSDLLDTTHDAIFVRNLADAITYWNRGAAERYGWTSQEALGSISHDLLRTEFPAPLASIRNEFLRTGRWEGELVHTKRGGSRVVVASRWALQTDDRGQPLAILETNNDITEQKRADAELRESEQKYRNIFQAVGVTIWEEDFSAVKVAIDALKAQGVSDFRRYLAEHQEFSRQAIGLVKVLDVNDAAIELFGARNKGELLRSLHHIFLPETQAAFADELITLAEGGSTITSETVLQSLTGERLDVLFTATFPGDPSIESVLVSIVDITERKKSLQALEHAQAELAHVNRVSTLGELAASIVHEVSQPLAAVVTNADAATRWLNRAPPDFGEVQQAIDEIAKVGKRAGDILGNIRAFVKKEPARKEPVDINQAVAEVVVLTRNEARRNGITVRTQLEQGLTPVIGDRVQLQQVLLNFILNAVDATSGVDENRRKVAISTTSVSNGIVVAVSDTGVGIDADRADELFKPFYTTKPRGMGMGLSICRSIIEAHGGQVRATRNTDAGATFQFVLPATPSEAA